MNTKKNLIFQLLSMRFIRALQLIERHMLHATCYRHLPVSSAAAGAPELY